MKRTLSDTVARSMMVYAVDCFRGGISEDLRAYGVPQTIPRVVYMFIQLCGVRPNTRDKSWFRKLASLGLRFEFSDTETMDCPFCDNVGGGCWMCDSGHAKKLIMRHIVAGE